MKNYFNNLNGIRFILAFAVLVLHTEMFKKLNGLPHYVDRFPAIVIAGEIAISLFFTLSGFLISYYLFIEKQTTKTIQLKTFYIKRILRIWPLYFLAILLYWFILPNTPVGNFFKNNPTHTFSTFIIFKQNISDGLAFLFYMLFMPQVPYIIGKLSNSIYFPAPHLWSIGVEEIFYLFIPYFILKTKNSLKTLNKITLFYFLLPLFFLILYRIQHHKFYIFILSFISVHNFCCMLLGTILAYLYIYKKEQLLRFCNGYIATITIIIFIVMMAKNIIFFWFIREIYSLLFCILIIYAIEHKSAILESKLLSYFGKISYGIYIYHNMVIAFVFYVLKINQLLPTTFIYYTLTTIVITIITILVSTISYQFFEKKFISLRKNSYA